MHFLRNNPSLRFSSVTSETLECEGKLASVVLVMKPKTAWLNDKENLTKARTRITIDSRSVLPIVKT